MSLGQVASSPQPSAPPAAVASTPAPDSAPSGNILDGTPNRAPDQTTTSQTVSQDWRALMAGEDTKSLEALARYQTPGDFLKSWNEQRAALSKRAEPARLPDNATPEQIGEWRKGIGLPELAKDAKAEDYMAAYKIGPPEGYEISNVEQGMLADFAKLAYEKGHSPREVKEAVDFFFQANAANMQAVNRAALEFQKKEQNTLRDKLGSAEYEAQQAAGEAWLKDQFKDSPEMLADILNAQMPSGGKLGDAAWFFDLIAKQAMGSGYTDRIMANAMESGGKSLGQQQAEIEALMFKDKAAYDEAMRPGGRYEKILDARVARGEIDDMGNEVKKRRNS